MVISKIYQKKLNDAIRLATSGDSLEVGKSVIYYAKHVLTQENVKKELNLDFDEIEIHPAQHDPNVADIILFKDGKLVRMINVKTCVSGVLKSTIRALRRSRRTNEDGLIIFGLACTRPDQTVNYILGMLFIDKEYLFSESIDNLVKTIVSKLKNKQKEEGCKDLTPYSLNQMIAMGSMVNSLKAIDAAEKASKSAEMARLTAEKASKSAEAASKNAERTWRVAEETRDRVGRLEEKMDEISGLIKDLIDKITGKDKRVKKK